jgi:hypothetical protein
MREVSTMMDSLLNLLFRCPHRRLTRPVTPAGKDGGPTYVVCLDCGKQFSYDLAAMRVGKPLPNSADQGVLPPGMPGSGKSKVKLALWASALPLGVLIGSAVSSKRRRREKSTEPQTNKQAKSGPGETF